MTSKKLRIAFGTPEYVTEKYFGGGLATYLGLITSSLARRGHDVHVVTLSEFEEGEFEHQGVTVHRINLRSSWRLLNALTRYRLPNALHWLNLSGGVYRKLRQLNRQQQFDLIQFPNYSYCGLVSMMLLRVPHVLRASSFEPFFNDANKENSIDFKALKCLEKFQAALSPHIYTASLNLQQLMSKQQRLDRVRVIPKPVSPDLAGWDYTYHDKLLKDKDYLLFFGRFEERKGFHLLAPALARVLADYPDVRAVLIGQDVATDSHASMAQYAHSLCGRFGDRFILLDKLRQPQLYPIVERAKLIVLPSLADNMPNACLEAMALGKAVIGLSGSSLGEMITDEETGFLVTPNSVDALVEKIIHAWEHPGLEAIGNAAKAKMLELSPDKTTTALLGYYQEVLLSREQSQVSLWRRRVIAKPALP